MLNELKIIFSIALLLLAFTPASAINKMHEPINTIPGWPNYLAMGTVTNNASSVATALTKTPVDAIFKYAGFDGAGDRGQIIDPTTTAKTVAQANFIQQYSSHHHQVMPVMVVYTIDASGSIYGAVDDVENLTDLTDHYINLIKLTRYLNSQVTTANPVPATLIMNPDFLGAMQQAGEWGPLQPTTPVAVQTALAKALAYLNIQKNIPNPTVLPNTLAGYVQSINWIIKTFSPTVPFGWQENLWAINSANWIHKDYTSDELKSEITVPIVNFIKSVGLYSGPYKPNFLVFDRYERDDFFINQTSWFYNHRDWNNYLNFVNNISRDPALNVPAVIWQIPGGHILTNHDDSTLQLNHVATATDFFFGDANVNYNFPQNIDSSVLSFQLLPSAYGQISELTAGAYLQQETDHNWNQPQLQNAVDHNIVAVLWGGGSTTAVATLVTNGDDGGWLASKVEAYYQNPVLLKGVSDTPTFKK